MNMLHKDMPALDSDVLVINKDVLELFKDIDAIRVKSIPSSESDGFRASEQKFKPQDHLPSLLEGGPEVEPVSGNETLEMLRKVIKEEVQELVGYMPQDDEPLMASGLDSRSAMELRGMLNRTLDTKLPATLLYDCQTVDAIAELVIRLDQEKPRTGEKAKKEKIDIEKLELSQNPTPTVKTLRGSVHRPLFLAAPGVANGQSAYFSFMAHLAYCDQPIYTLEKDNAYTIKDLAALHVEDMIKIQPFGPYLIGGHSYGGVVAIEVAIQLEQMGREVGAVFAFDAPHPCQIRQADADSMGDDRDAIELMEMILEAIDFGHERSGWPSMKIMEKYAYFAPIYRVMRDQNFTVAQVREQVLAIANAIKTGDQPSDIRHHEFSGKLNRGTVYYFRARERGAVTYVEDQDDSLFAHGVGYKKVINRLAVIDVPGDHFSMLRQNGFDMDIIQSTMQQVLSKFGWNELKEHKRKPFKLSAEDTKEMDEYLSKMGIRKDDISDSLKRDMPWAFGGKGSLPFGEVSDDDSTTIDNVFDVVLDNNPEPLLPLEVDVQPVNDVRVEDSIPIYFFHDITGLVTLAKNVAAHLDVPCFGVALPPISKLGTIESLEHLVEIYVEAIKRTHPHGPYIFAGFGFGCHLAYEAACQLGEQRVAGLVLFDGQITLPEFQQDAIWCALYSVVAPHKTVEEFVGEMQSHEGFDDQLDYLGEYCPDAEDRTEWEAMINNVLLQAHFCALAADQYDPSELYNGPSFMLSREGSETADTAEINARSYMIKLVAMSHFGFDGSNSMKTAEAMKACMGRGLEAWEDMALHESECRLFESRTLLRRVSEPEMEEPEQPYVDQWVTRQTLPEEERDKPMSSMRLREVPHRPERSEETKKLLKKVEGLIAEMKSERGSRGGSRSGSRAGSASPGSASSSFS